MKILLYCFITLFFAYLGYSVFVVEEYYSKSCNGNLISIYAYEYSGCYQSSCNCSSYERCYSISCIDDINKLVLPVDFGFEFEYNDTSCKNKISIYGYKIGCNSIDNLFSNFVECGKSYKNQEFPTNNCTGIPYYSIDLPISTCNSTINSKGYCNLKPSSSTYVLISISNLIIFSIIIYFL